MTQVSLFVLAESETTGSLSGHFTWIDWAIVAGYLLVTTVIGGWLAGRQKSFKDFFLGGRKLPWYAVAGSIIATELSAVTFVSVPFVVFQPEGNLTYLQLGLIGALIARLVAAYVLIPAYYKYEIYSPYDYMGRRLGGNVRGMTTGLFTLGGILAQSARVYLTAVVLELVLHGPLGNLEAVTGIGSLAWAVIIIGIVSVAWTLMGGITTVIWTDLILFFVFVIGSVVALATIVWHLPGGMGQVVNEGWEAGKFTLIDPDPSPTKTFTVWTAALAAPFMMLGSVGTDQLMAQRIFTCRNEREARWAVLASYGGQAVTLLVAIVGVGLYVYYQHNPLEGAARAAYEEEGDRIFPIFILTVIPAGLTGLIVAGLFAAAISSLDSILSALSQTSMSAFYLPARERWLSRRRADEEGADDAEQWRENRHRVRVSRLFVMGWAVVLCVAAMLAQAASAYYPAILELALSLATYTWGPLLAGFFLGFLPLGINGRGYMFAAPLAVLTVFALAWHHQAWSTWVCIAGAVVLLAAWMGTLRWPGLEAMGKTVLLLAGAGLMVVLSLEGLWERLGFVLAWPWYTVIGAAVAFGWGYGLADARENADGDESGEERQD